MQHLTWAINYKDFKKFKEKYMDNDLTPEIQDLIKIYEEDIIECKATEEQYLFYLNNYLKPYCDAFEKRKITEEKLQNLRDKLKDDQGDEE